MARSPFAVAMFVAGLATTACQSAPPARPPECVVTGTGLVTGVAPKGASDRATRQAILNLARQQGLDLTMQDVVDASVALVLVTGAVPEDAIAGQEVRVRCDAADAGVSLRGGQLLRCELRDASGQVRAIAAGPVVTATNGSADHAPSQNGQKGWVLGGLVVR